MVKCDPREGKYSKCLLGLFPPYVALKINSKVACALLYRGDVAPQGHSGRCCEYQDKANNPVRRLVPDRFQGLLFSTAYYGILSHHARCYLQLGICYEAPACVPGGDLAKTTRSLCMLSKLVHLHLYLVHDLTIC
jgi:tubulin alpha